MLRSQRSNCLIIHAARSKQKLITLMCYITSANQWELVLDSSGRVVSGVYQAALLWRLGIMGLIFSYGSFGILSRASFQSMGFRWILQQVSTVWLGFRHFGHQGRPCLNFSLSWKGCEECAVPESSRGGREGLWTIRADVSVDELAVGDPSIILLRLSWWPTFENIAWRVGNGGPQNPTMHFIKCAIKAHKNLKILFCSTTAW